MEQLLQDLRYAGRTLGRSPGFTLVAVLTLALGIGATTTIFSVVNALLLRPLPVDAPERLVRLDAQIRSPEDGSLNPTTWSFPDYQEYAAREDIFSGVAARHHWSMLLGDEEVARITLHAVTGNYFDVLGLPPILGRTLTPADDRSGDPAQVAVISRAMWENRFQSDPEIVGRTILLDGHPFTVVGVIGAEEVFRAIGEPEAWIPVQTRAMLTPGINPVDTRRVSFIPAVIGRLRPGVSFEQAQAAVEVVTHQLATAHPETNANRVAVMRRAGTLQGFALGAERAEMLRFASALLLAVVAIVLLIASANVANLMLVRAVSRGHELGIRAALGAGRRRIAQQLLTESLVLALLGGLAGLGLAVGGLRLAQQVRDVAQLSPTLDRSVLAFTLLVALGTGLLFGLAPVVVTDARRLAGALRGTRTTTRRLHLQRFLLVGQIALALLLVVASGLVLRTLRNLTEVDPGFHPQRLLIVDVQLPAEAADGPERLATATRDLLEQVRALPGVERASVSSIAPLSGSRMIYFFEIPGYEPAPGEEVRADITTVEDDYFRTVGLPLLGGRDFSELPPGETGSVIINEAMARRFWPGRDPVGERFVITGDTVQVGGVVANMRHIAIGEEPVPMLFFRHPQMAYGSFALHVRTQGPAAALSAPVRRIVQAATPGQPAPQVRPMSELVRASISQARVTATFFTLLGGLAVLLAAVGLYGVMAFSVAQRTREMGIRIALGADVVHVIGQVLRESAVLVAVGVAIGLAAAMLATRLIRGVLYEVEPTDPTTFLLSTAALLLVGLLASYIPARRAARVDPMVALRAE